MRTRRNAGEAKAGVDADWAQLPAYLEKSLRGLAVESQEALAVGRSWSLRWKGQPFHLEAHVQRRDEVEPLSPTRFGGERSKEKVGDLLIAFDFKPELLWQFKNVTLHLRALSEDLPQAPTPIEGARLLQLAKTVQSFVETWVVSELDAVTPRLELPSTEDTTLLLGTPLRLAYRALNVPPEECHLDIRGEGLKVVTRHASELIAMPERVGAVQLWLNLLNTRSLLRSTYVGLTFQAVRDRDRPPMKVQARYLVDARLEEGPRVRLWRDTGRASNECTGVFVVPLDENRSVALQFGGPRYSSAPPSIAMRLQKALLLDGARAPVPLPLSEFHLDWRRFPELRGTFSLAARDWEIAAVSAGAPSDSTWVEELRRQGLEIG